MSRKYLIVGNWKMNLNRKQVVELLVRLKTMLYDIHDAIEVVVCPPSVYLDLARMETKLSNLKLGAQNVAQTSETAFTGEVSATMLSEFGCKYVIIGHSERRSLLGETDEQIANKLELARLADITPILCVGEQADEGFGVIAKQIEAVMKRVGEESMAEAVIAYEPVWAIGTGNTPTPDQIQDTHARIKELLPKKLKVLYGGSVKSSNAKEILEQPDVDGCLIGGASLKAQEFSDICHIAMGIIK